MQQRTEFWVGFGTVVGLLLAIFGAVIFYALYVESCCIQSCREIGYRSPKQTNECMHQCKYGPHSIN